jgi:KDO2-lipid IV(A) lauroyltransferase
LVDQRVSEGSVEAEFFGQEALTTALPAIAALRLGTPVFFVFVRRTPELRYIMEVEGPLPIEMTGYPKRDVQINTQRFNDRLEAEIRKDPSRWLWMHDRWRLEGGPKR